MLKWIAPSLLILAGVGVFGVGLVYSAVMAGVPGPDDPPAVVAQERQDGDIAMIVMLCGFLAGSTGMAWLVFTLVVSLVRRGQGSYGRDATRTDRFGTPDRSALRRG